jgi:HD-GYP domain-containing protein (c-di-GMP phosphodiesterase class II)
MPATAPHWLKISPDRLRRGMYVAALDRPWLVTPLRFQGFRIVDEDRDLEWIREHCAYVWVDAERSDVEEITLDMTNAPHMTASHPTLREGHAMPPGASTPPPSTPQPPSSRLWTRSGWWNRRTRPGGPSAVGHASEPSTTLRRSVAQAHGHYSTASQALDDVLETLRTGGRLDVRVVERAITPVVDAVLESTEAMTCVVQLRALDPSAYARGLAVSIWSVVLGKSLGLGRTKLLQLGQGGLLLDVGMARLPPRLREPAASLATLEARIEYARHVEIGLEILRRTRHVHPAVLQMVASHHERHDGSGYPRGLAGSAIPLFGRIGGLVDMYETLRAANRAHVRGSTTFEVMRGLAAASGTLFDTELVDRLIGLVGVFPAASVVELNTGEVGIVVRQNPERRLRPQLLMVLDQHKQPRGEQPLYDLATFNSDATEPGSVWITQGLEPGAFGVDPRQYL